MTHHYQAALGFVSNQHYSHIYAAFINICGRYILIWGYCPSLSTSHRFHYSQQQEQTFLFKMFCPEICIMVNRRSVSRCDPLSAQYTLCLHVSLHSLCLCVLVSWYTTWWALRDVWRVWIPQLNITGASKLISMLFDTQQGLETCQPVCSCLLLNCSSMLSTGKLDCHSLATVNQFEKYMLSFCLTMTDKHNEPVYPAYRWVFATCHGIEAETTSSFSSVRKEQRCSRARDQGTEAP